MANNSTINATPAGAHDRPALRQVESLHDLTQDLEELTPLQRQRLVTAVMMLVDYLVSAAEADT